MEDVGVWARARQTDLPKSNFILIQLVLNQQKDQDVLTITILNLLYVNESGNCLTSFE